MSKKIGEKLNKGRRVKLLAKIGLGKLVVIGIATLLVSSTLIYLLLDYNEFFLQGDIDFDGLEQPFIAFDGTQITSETGNVVLTDMDINTTVTAGYEGTFTHTFTSYTGDNYIITFNLSNMPNTGVWEGITIEVRESGTTNTLTEIQLDALGNVDVDFYYSVDDLFAQPNPDIDFPFDLRMYLDKLVTNFPSGLCAYSLNDNGEDIFGYYDLSDTGTPVYTTGKIGNALTGDMTASNYLEDTSGDLDFGDYNEAFSFNFWFNYTTFDGGTRFSIIDKYDTIADRGLKIDFSAQRIYFTLTSDTGNKLEVLSDVIPSGTWHMITITKDIGNSESDVNLFIDTVLSTKIVNSDTLTATILNSENVKLGSSLDNTRGQKVDMLVSTTNVMTNATIAILWNTGSGTEDIFEI